MRLLDYLTGLISLLALPFILWWGVNQSPHSAAALQARLETGAQAALQREGVDWARVSMDGQTAILRGAAPSEDAVEDAARIVLRSTGKGGLLFGGVSQVRTEVTEAAAVRPYTWSVEKAGGGGLVLSGYVPSRAARAALRAEAEALAAGPIEDRMVLAAGAPAGNWQGIARLAMEQVAELDTGSAEMSDHVLTVRGDLADEVRRAEMTATITAIAGPFRGVALIGGQPLWSAVRTDTGLVLSGQVPGEAERRALLAAARKGFDGDVRDEMTVATSGAEGWIEGAKAALAHLGAFSTGTLAFDPAVNGFTLEGEAPASTLQFLDEDLMRAAGRWRYVIVASPARLAEPEALTAGDGCADRLNGLLAGPDVRFLPGRAEFSRESAAGLDEIARVAGACAQSAVLDVEVDGDALAEARAATFADFLERAGAPRPRIAAIGYGSIEAVEAMDVDAAAPTDRPLQFTVRERSTQ